MTLDLATLGDDVDSDDDGTTLSYAILGAVAEGSASISGTELTFTPGADFQDLALGETRDVAISIEATDAHGPTAISVVTVTIISTKSMSPSPFRCFLVLYSWICLWVDNHEGGNESHLQI